MWSDYFKIFNYSFKSDPTSLRDKTQNVTGAGYPSPEGIGNIRNSDDLTTPGEKGALRVGNDFVDLNAVSDRGARIKEYDRLRSIPEIEQVMTVIADEACLAGDTEVATLYHGYKTIKWLAENKANEEFFVYCWDFDKEDYTLGVAYDPRLVKKEKTVKVILDDGTEFVATRDHLVLLRNQAWTTAGSIKAGDELMPFYRLPAHTELSENKKNQFPRIFTHNNGWINERQFIANYTRGKIDENNEKSNRIAREVLNNKNTSHLSQDIKTTRNWLRKEGFSIKELRWLGKKADRRRVLAVLDHEEVDVYDLSVQDHKNFCGKSVIFHNCQKDQEGNVLKITTKNEEIQKELNFLFLNRNMLNMNRKLWGMCKKTCINGDHFLELCIDMDDPKNGILKVVDLPCESVYRIETTKGRLIEFQQAANNGGPDYEALTKPPVTSCTDSQNRESRNVRFTPEQIVHIRLGEDRKTFYPYGQSLIEPARGPAHQLRLMEDSMVVYRLVRAPERKVFYIDVGTMQGYRAETFMTRMRDMLRKKKVLKPGAGNNSVDEKWSPPSADEDYWIPIRPNSNTRIDTLPGASNLGEIDDTVYFRNKVYAALNFPANYFSNEDTNATRITLSSQHARFARMIERIQEPLEDALWEIAHRHLQLRGYSADQYDDLVIKITIPSEYRELSRAEIENDRVQRAANLKTNMLMDDLTIMTDILKLKESKAEMVASRIKIQKMEDARLQIMVQNPQILGIGTPGPNETQIGAEAGGPSPMLDGQPPEDGQQPPTPPEEGQAPDQNANQGPAMSPHSELEDPDEDDIKKYDLQILNYDQEKDQEEIDYSEF